MVAPVVRNLIGYQLQLSYAFYGNGQKFHRRISRHRSALGKQLAVSINPENCGRLVSFCNLLINSYIR